MSCLENDMIMEIDNDPNVVIETGRIGKYSYIHKYIPNFIIN